MIKWFKHYAADVLISVTLLLPSFLIGWYNGYYEGTEDSKVALKGEYGRLIQDCYRLNKDLAVLREQYYKVSNNLKDTMTEMLRCKLELQEKEGSK